MAFLTVKEENVKAAEASSYIQTSGIYKMTLKHGEVVNTANGAVQMNYFFDKCMSYGNNIIGVNGQPTFGYKILEALATVLGQDELSNPEPTNVAFKSGTKELNCIPELEDVVVQAWIQFSYRMYKGEIQESVTVRRFYRESDGASGSEVLTGENVGERLGKDREVASEIKYEDGVTPEAVAAWKKAQASGNRGSATPTKSAAEASGFPGSAPKASSGFPSA